MATFEEVSPLIEAKIAELGYELFEMRFFKAGSRSVIRITVDSSEGIKIADCERVSHAVSDLLDNENFSPDWPYNLEVSSPGIDRPLKTERDYQRIAGRDVIIHLRDGVEGKKTIVGEVVSCKEGMLKIIFENKTLDIPLSDIYSGKEEIRFK